MCGTIAFVLANDRRVARAMRRRKQSSRRLWRSSRMDARMPCRHRGLVCRFVVCCMLVCLPVWSFVCLVDCMFVCTVRLLLCMLVCLFVCIFLSVGVCLRLLSPSLRVAVRVYVCVCVGVCPRVCVRVYVCLCSPCVALLAGRETIWD